MTAIENNFSLINKTRASLPAALGDGARFASMKDAVLGADYELSMVIADDKLSQGLNDRFRGKDHPTDILSFPLSDRSGEIFLNLKQCKKKAREFDRTYENYLEFVFIHGLVHLKGFDHGSKMEHEEMKIRTQFGI